MSKTAKKILKEELNRLKKALEKLVNPGNKPLPSYVLQPVRNKKNT